MLNFTDVDIEDFVLYQTSFRQEETKGRNAEEIFCYSFFKKNLNKTLASVKYFDVLYAIYCLRNMDRLSRLAVQVENIKNIEEKKLKRREWCIMLLRSQIVCNLRCVTVILYNFIFRVTTNFHLCPFSGYQSKLNLQLMKTGLFRM